MRPSPRWCAARNGRRCENPEIGVAAREAIEPDLAIPYGCKLTAQETWWGTMLGGRFKGVDNADARARLERGDEIVQQGVRFCDLVIHVHQDRNVGRVGWQSWIVWLASSYRDVLQAKSAHSLRRFCKYSGTTSSAMMRPCAPTIGDSRST